MRNRQEEIYRELEKQERVKTISPLEFQDINEIMKDFDLLYKKRNAKAIILLTKDYTPLISKLMN